MKAYVVPRVGALELADIPVPKIGQFDALVRIDICGICNSTDCKLIDGLMYWAPPFPFVLGHESVGTVVEVGSKVTKFHVGDRVTRPVFVASDSLNSAVGGFAEYGVVHDGPARAASGDNSLAGDYAAPRQNVVPDGLSDVEASLCISLSETASMLDPLPNLAGKSVLIAGPGVAGVSVALWCKLAGARTVMLGRRPERLDWARRVGADVALDTSDADWPARILADRGKVDGIIEASGSVALAEQLPALLGEGGFALAYGVPPTGQHYDPVWTIPDINEHLRYAWVGDLLKRGIVKASDFVSHTWSFDQLPEAFGQVRRGEVLKGYVKIRG
jgi:threonine dehydrogenase-like Zn-dependent dehydrogenase